MPLFIRKAYQKNRKSIGSPLLQKTTLIGWWKILSTVKSDSATCGWTPLQFIWTCLVRGAGIGQEIMAMGETLGINGFKKVG
jgi:hypothetical protein